LVQTGSGASAGLFNFSNQLVRLRDFLDIPQGSGKFAGGGASQEVLSKIGRFFRGLYEGSKIFKWSWEHERAPFIRTIHLLFIAYNYLIKIFNDIKMSFYRQSNHRHTTIAGNPLLIYFTSLFFLGTSQ
jgi:hypothetical protein